MTDKSNRIKRLEVRITEKELETIRERYTRSTSHKLSDYIRRKVLDKPISVYHRNQSLDDFMAEMIALRNELNAIGNNYNQVVKRLHTLRHFAELKGWLLLHENSFQKLMAKVEEIKLKINQINDQWLQ